MKQRYALLALALTVAGCAPLRQDTAFHGEPGKGFLVISAEGHWQSSDARFFLVIRRLNAAKNDFIKHQTVAYFTGQSDFPDDEFVRPKATNPSLRLAGLHLIPGDYALVTFVSDGYSERGNTTFIKCYALGTSVYHIKEGVVNLVRFNANHDQPLLDPEIVKSNLVATLAAYPNISAPIDMAVPIGSISFATSKNILGNPTCDADGPLSFTIPPSPQGSAKQ